MKKILSITIASVIFIITGCKENNLPPAYIGSWKAGTTTLVLNSNNTYQLTNASASYTGSGSYSINNSTMTVKDVSGVCGPAIIGTYTFDYFVGSVTGTFVQQLNLSLVTDTCDKRAAAIPGNYTMNK